jgi:tetratricopeptide (TPR) repeat protein
MRLDPSRAAYPLAAAEVRLRMDNREAAIAHAAKAAKLAGGDAALWKAIAALQARANDGLGEARSLQNCIRLAPGERAPYVRLVTLLLDHRTADGALAAASAGLDRFGADAELLRLHGVAAYALGRKAEAIQSFLKAIDAAPNDDTNFASLETLLPDAGGAAPEILRRLRPYAERNAIGRYLIALLLPAEAEDQLRAAAKGSPDFWPAHYELGRLLRNRGDRAEASEEFQIVLRLNPAHAESHYALSQLVAAPEKARFHRQEHHRLRQMAAQADRARAASKPRINVAIQ